MAEKKPRAPRKPAKAIDKPAASAAALDTGTAASDPPRAQSAPAAKTPLATPQEGRVRAIIDAVLPCVDGGRFPAKRIAGEPVHIEAHCFADGHDKLRAVMTWQAVNDTATYDVEMKPQVNDVWTADFTPPAPGRYRYTVTTWVDHFESWRGELERRTDVTDIRTALQVGAGLIEETAKRASNDDAVALTTWAGVLRQALEDPEHRDDPAALKGRALDPARGAIAARYPDRQWSTHVTLELVADRKKAQFSAWYELFPRSSASEPGRHGTFRDVQARLPYLTRMGFDILYLPHIHPIGKINRKGVNNTLSATPNDVGSPWAIGSAEGGHKAILPALGTLDDFKTLVSKAREAQMEIALDIAFQCAPDHPYVKEHPSWFRHRPDGSVQYAENPPKKYQDIYPFDFESDDWRGLWVELKSVLEYWIAQGVRVFRVDNPHTKSFAFWEWVIAEIKRDWPEVIFLAEAFTRPKVMLRLAKLGFTQSYTYFTWRTAKQEIVEYFTELSSEPENDYFRPNVWPNTPDILHESLQSGLRAVYAARLVLASTLAANYGIYGPTFELMQSTPRESGSEEYRDSEKYQLQQWDLDKADSLWPLIARVNRIRRDNPALHSDRTLSFCNIDNPQLIAYLKHDPSSDNTILTVVNLDPHHAQSGWLDLNLKLLGIDADSVFQVHDLLSDQRYQWRGARNYVMLEPWRMPAHVFKLRRLVRSERDFDYFL